VFFIRLELNSGKCLTRSRIGHNFTLFASTAVFKWKCRNTYYCPQGGAADTQIYLTPVSVIFIRKLKTQVLVVIAAVISL